MTPTIHFERFYDDELTFNIDRFRTNFFGEIIISADYFLCLNYGWNSDKVTATLETTMSFMDCYKDVIINVLDWSNWTGKNARIIDKCA